jgi:hypothetical protein
VLNQNLVFLEISGQWVSGEWEVPQNFSGYARNQTRGITPFSLYTVDCWIIVKI